MQDKLNEARAAQRRSLVDGYRAMSDEMAEFAKSALPLAAEVWPEYIEGDGGRAH